MFVLRANRGVHRAQGMRVNDTAMSFRPQLIPGTTSVKLRGVAYRTWEPAGHYEYRN